MGETILYESGISITVYEWDVVTSDDMPWRADVTVSGGIGKIIVDGLTRQAVIDKGELLGLDRIEFAKRWPKGRIRGAARSEAEAETQLDLL
ncbi:hypothetical protein HPT29_018590 [Microvirga terrae]|uniref:Uncharacterized protein n=1 Tax=Microvirga terrae TaxID=2740529 RepID=A0ABY5RMM1_9HYPH|nr:hypothetical protein [Microvirga terrae]UVF18481.1 hypothetical protein HPT29_018590 [Microvirga terrae]